MKSRAMMRHGSCIMERRPPPEPPPSLASPIISAFQFSSVCHKPHLQPPPLSPILSPSISQRQFLLCAHLFSPQPLPLPLTSLPSLLISYLSPQAIQTALSSP